MSSVILNSMPPSTNDMPSVSCEVLKSFLSQSKIDSKVIYWNHIFNNLMENWKKSLGLKPLMPISHRHDIYDILPFLAILTEQNKDEKIKGRLLTTLISISPENRILGEEYFEKKYIEIQKYVTEKINDILFKTITSETILFGISVKFDGWIPGIIIADQVKKLFPKIKIVIGGFENRKFAEIIFNKTDSFDYAIWGEGEIPLLNLCQSLINQENDFNTIPRILYKNNGNPIQTINETDEHYFNLNNYTIPDYTDYFDSIKSNSIDMSKGITFPLEKSRGCRWNQCNFCALNIGYKYRERDVDNLIEEVKYLFKTHGIKDFFFVDNDVIGRNSKKFEEFLENLILLSKELNTDLTYHADMLHLNLTSTLIKKISLAGFKSIQIGYEGISDRMLKKLNKSTSFADNILFVKFALKYDIEVTISGLIIGIPGENESDVKEYCINLHFLRFFLKKKVFFHPYAELMLFNGTKFYNMLPENERDMFKYHPVYELLPEQILSQDEGYTVLGLTRTPENKGMWDLFTVINRYYEETNFTYHLFENDGIVHYYEYKENIKIASYEFDKPIYWDILKTANNKIVSLQTIENTLQDKYPDHSQEKIKNILYELKSCALLYANESLSKIVSVINTDELK